MFKKIIVIPVLLVVFLTSFSLFAFAKDIVNPAYYGLAPEQIRYKEKCLFLEKARQYGIETSGLIEEQLKENVTAKENEDILAKANMYGVDTNGLTLEQLREKVKLKEDEAVIAKAKNAGIDVDGLTAEQVIAKVSELDKQLPVNNPGALNPAKSEQTKDNPYGLTPEQIKYKEKFTLLETARQYGIDTNGLNDEQIKEKIDAKAKELQKPKK